MQPKAAIVQRDKDKGQVVVKFGSKLCFIEIEKSVANRKYYTKIPMTTSTKNDRKYRYFQSRDEYDNYLKRKAGVKVQSPPDFEKSILCRFRGVLCMVKSQMGLAGMPDRVEKPGSRGGKYWIDKQGKVQYGEKPKGRVKKPEDQPKAKPQASIFGGEDKPQIKKKPDAQQTQKQREMAWLMEKIKSGKLPKGAAKLVNPKKTSPKKQAENVAKWDTGLFSEGKKQQGLFDEKEKKVDVKYASETELQMKYREKNDVFQLLKEKIEIEDYFEKYPKLKSDENTLAQYNAIQELLKKPINIQQTAYAKRNGSYVEEYNESKVLINREKIGTPGKAQETVDSINKRISEQKRKGKISTIAQSIDTDDLIRQLRLMKNKVYHKENVEIVLEELKRRNIKNFDIIYKEFSSAPPPAANEPWKMSKEEFLGQKFDFDIRELPKDEVKFILETTKDEPKSKNTGKPITLSIRKNNKDIVVTDGTHRIAEAFAKKKYILQAGWLSKDPQMTKYHKTLIEQALASGKPVPPEVLKDYPELKAGEKKTADDYRKMFSDKWEKARKQSFSEYKEPYYGGMGMPSDPDSEKRQSRHWELIVKQGISKDELPAFQRNFKSETYHSRDYVISIAKNLGIKTDRIATKKLISEIESTALKNNKEEK